MLLCAIEGKQALMSLGREQVVQRKQNGELS